MFNFIINFFNKNQNETQNENKNFCIIYNEQYRNSYNKLWIKNLDNYYP